MEVDGQTAASSTATAPEAPPIEKWSDKQRSDWLRTGKTPTPEAPKTEESAPSTPAAEQKPAESAPASEAGKKQEPPKPRGAEQRKEQLAAEIQDLLRQRAELRREIAEAGKGGKQPEAAAAPPTEQPKEQPRAAERPKRPKVDDFENYEAYDQALDKYVEDLTAWQAKQTLEADRTARQQADDQRKAQEATQSKQRTLAEKLIDASQKHSDFAGKLAEFEAEHGGVSQTIADTIAESEHGAELAYHLVTHPEEVQRIGALGPLAQARELGKIEASLAGTTKPPEPPKPKTTAASPPPTELSGKTTAPEDEAKAALEAGDFQRYKRIMDARDLKKG